MELRLLKGLEFKCLRVFRFVCRMGPCVLSKLAPRAGDSWHRHPFLAELWIRASLLSVCQVHHPIRHHRLLPKGCQLLRVVAGSVTLRLHRVSNPDVGDRKSSRQILLQGLCSVCPSEDKFGLDSWLWH